MVPWTSVRASRKSGGPEGGVTPVPLAVVWVVWCQGRRGRWVSLRAEWNYGGRPHPRSADKHPGQP